MMLSFRRHEFKRRLLWKAWQRGVLVLEVNEACSSRTRSWGGGIKENPGRRTAIRDGSGFGMDRDTNGARGIFLRALGDSPSCAADRAVCIGADRFPCSVGQRSTIGSEQWTMPRPSPPRRRRGRQPRQASARPEGPPQGGEEPEVEYHDRHLHRTQLARLRLHRRRLHRVLHHPHRRTPLMGDPAAGRGGACVRGAGGKMNLDGHRLTPSGLQVPARG